MSALLGPAEVCDRRPFSPLTEVPHQPAGPFRAPVDPVMGWGTGEPLGALVSWSDILDFYAWRGPSLVDVYWPEMMQGWVGR